VRKTKLPVVLVTLVGLLLAVGSLFTFGKVEFLSAPVEEESKDHFAFKPVKTEVRGIKIVNQTPRHIELEIDYGYSGSLGPAFIQAVSISEHNPKREYHRIFGLDDEVMIFRGQRTVKVLVKREDDVSTPYKTNGFEIQLARNPGESPFYRKEYQQTVSWPAYDRASDPYFKNRERGVFYNMAVHYIDTESDLWKAKYYLDRIIVATPDYAPAHYQLGRVFFKANQSEKGLKAATESAMTAIAIDPEFADTYILLGHVLLHQKKYKESAKQFVIAEKKGTENLWLYSRWGELHKAKNEFKQAAEKLEKVVAMPLSDKNNNDAIEYSYSELLGIYKEQKKWEDMERLYNARIDKFPKNNCYKAHYANYLINNLKELDKAELMATDARNTGCPDRSFTTPILAKVLYYRWSLLDPTSKEGLIAFSRAKAISPVDPHLLYNLATSEKLVKVIKALTAIGKNIDMVNDRGMTALTYAIQNNDVNTAKNLLAIGADVNQVLESRVAGKWTPLMAATAVGDVDMVKMLIQNGANPNFKNKDGVGASDIAKDQGNDNLHKLLVAYSA
jgi:tetratricopeptide (TPR) repeat protein